MVGPPNRSFQNNAAGKKAEKKEKAKSFASKYRSGKGVVDTKTVPKKSSNKKVVASNSSVDSSSSKKKVIASNSSASASNKKKLLKELNAPTYPTNFGLASLDQTQFLPSSYDGYQGFPESYGKVYQGDPTVSTKSNNFFGDIDTNKVAADSSAVGKSVDPVSTVPNVAGGFTDEVAAAAGPSELVKTIEDLTTFKKGGKDDVKNIMSKVRDMEKAINGSVQLSNYDKLQYKDQIKYAKANFAKMGYSLNEVMAAVGTNAFNKMVSKTPVSRDDAAAFSTPEFNAVDAVQGVMDNYERAAVFKGYGPDGKPIFGPKQPTGPSIYPEASMGEVFGDIKRRLIKDAQNFGGLSKFTPGGMIANLFSGKNQSTANLPGGVRQEPKFGFGDIPSGANQYLTGDYAKYINSPINLSAAARGESSVNPDGYNPFMAPSAPVAGAQRALNNAMRSGGGGGQQSQIQQGSESEKSTTAPGPLSYQTYAKPVAYNYFGGPEQIYLGGGYQQDGKTIGPFGYANGGIANFKPYGY